MTTETILAVPPEDICLQHNIRTDIQLDKEFVESIAAQGILVRTTVNLGPCEHGKPYIMVAGHRRTASLMKAMHDGKLPDGAEALVPIEVIAQSRELNVVAMLVENLQRTDLDPIDEGAAYAELVQSGWTQVDLAASVGKSTGHVSQRLALLGLSPEAKALLRQGKLTLENAVMLAKIGNDRVLEIVEGQIAKQGVPSYGLDGVISSAKRKVQAQDEQDQRLTKLRAEGVACGKGPLKGGVVVLLNGKGHAPYGAQRIYLDMTEAKFVKEPGAYVQVKMESSVYSSGSQVSIAYFTAEPGRYVPVPSEDGTTIVKPVAADKVNNTPPTMSNRDPVAKAEREKAAAQRQEFVRGWAKSRVGNDVVMRLMLPELVEGIVGNTYDIEELTGITDRAQMRAYLKTLKNAEVLKLWTAMHLWRKTHVQRYGSQTPSSLLVAAGYEPTEYEQAALAHEREQAAEEWTEVFREIEHNDSNEPWYPALVLELEVMRASGEAPDHNEIDELLDRLSGNGDEEEGEDDEVIEEDLAHAN